MYIPEITQKSGKLHDKRLSANFRFVDHQYPVYSMNTICQETLHAIALTQKSMEI